MVVLWVFKTSAHTFLLRIRDIRLALVDLFQLSLKYRLVSTVPFANFVSETFFTNRMIPMFSRTFQCIFLGMHNEYDFPLNFDNPIFP